MQLLNFIITPFYNQHNANRQRVVADSENSTIGLLICKSKDNTVVEWSFRGMSQPLGVAEYQLIKTASEKAVQMLPSESELQKVIDTY